MGIVGGRVAKGGGTVGGFNAAHPRDRRGRFADKPDHLEARNQKKAVGRSGGGAVKEATPSSRSARAKAAYRPTLKGKQDFAEHNEVVIARKIKGRALPDNEPADILIGVRGQRGFHGIELKTVCDSANNKITVKREARVRKEKWMKENNATFHTVVSDRRNVYEGRKYKKSYSGHDLYYRRGSGAFRLDGLYRVKNYAELKRLINMPVDKLPLGAK